MVPVVQPCIDSVAWLYRFLKYDNFAPIIEGEAYRSAQMSHCSLQAVVQEKGIRSVIDLRCGVPDRNAQGEHEGTVARRAGAKYFHMPFVTSATPYREQIAELVWLFDNAPRPVLMHCASGQHRTGTAAAIWILTQHPHREREAFRQLSVKFGFFPFEYHLSRFRYGREPLAQLIERFRRRSDARQAFRYWYPEVLFELPEQLRKHLRVLPDGRVWSFNPYCNNREADC